MFTVYVCVCVCAAGYGHITKHTSVMNKSSCLPTQMPILGCPHHREVGRKGGEEGREERKEGRRGRKGRRKGRKGKGREETTQATVLTIAGEVEDVFQRKEIEPRTPCSLPLYISHQSCPALQQA